MHNDFFQCIYQLRCFWSIQISWIYRVGRLHPAVQRGEKKLIANIKRILNQIVSYLPWLHTPLTSLIYSTFSGLDLGWGSQGLQKVDPGEEGGGGGGGGHFSYATQLVRKILILC